MAIRKVPFLKGAFTPLVVPFKNGAVDYDRYAAIECKRYDDFAKDEARRNLVEK